MSHFDELMKTLKAAAYERGVATLAKEANISDDTLRRMLGDDPPQFLKNLRRLEEVAAVRP